MNLDKDLREFVELLNSANVEYLIVGGYAVGFHGKPRFTGDIDFFVAVNPANAAATMRVIESFGFGGIGVSIDDFLRPDYVVQLGFPPNRIDLVTGISGVRFEDAWPSRVRAQLDGVPVHFISKEFLIQNKRASARDKDLADLRTLESSD
ncbi:MAG TPA: nucleotidyltransferase [Phycisphaerae bacterium]|nr:nucleotidyltransferase [Phycisphaerae bacterium]